MLAKKHLSGATIYLNKQLITKTDANGTKVAEIKGQTLVKLGYWSVTTTKHINYAANELGLKLL